MDHKMVACRLQLWLPNEVPPVCHLTISRLKPEDFKHFTLHMKRCSATTREYSLSSPRHREALLYVP